GPQQADEGCQSSGTEHALSSRPKMGSELGYQPHGHDDPTRPLIRALRGSGCRWGPEESATLDDGTRAASLEVKDSGTAGHLGRRHQDERRTPGCPRGDVVENAE